METPNTVEESLRVLLREIGALQVIRDKVASTNEYSNTMHSWLMNVKEKTDEVIGLEEKFIGCRTFRLRYMFNRKVLDLLKFVHVQKEVGTALYDSSKTLCSEPNRFTLASLNSFTSNFSQNIHSHCSENVYRGQFPNGVQVVVKKLTEIDAVEDVFVLEVNKLLNVFHRNLVRFYGFCFEKSMKALVFEYVPNGSLDRILFDNYNNYIQWELLYDIVTETAKGLSYLHDGCVHQLLHCDLKASNVLLDSNMKPKVTNFGLSKLLSKDLTHLTISKDQGDPSYPAPEIMTLSSCVTEKCDVYSFGLMLFEVLGKRRVVSGGVYFPRFVWNIFEKEGMGSVIKECGITVNKEKAMILCMVAFWCIQYTPENRPSMSTVIKMLDRQIKVGKPPSPFFPDFPYSVKSFADVNYKSSDFGSNLYESHLSDLLEAPENSGPALGTEQPSSTGGLLHTHTGARSFSEMASGDLFRVEPAELIFSDEFKIQICTLQISNITDKHIAFRVRATHPNKYSVHPSAAVLFPRSTRKIEVKTLEECEFPTDMQCKHKFLIQGVITNARITDKDVTPAMFTQNSKDLFQQCKLKVVSTHQNPSPVPEQLNDGSSTMASVPDNNPKADEKSQEQTSQNASLQRSSARSESIHKLIRELATDKQRQFSREDIISFTSNLTTPLGSGAFGTVYKGQFLNGVEIAVKVLENEVVEEEFMAEMSTMGKTYHRNLVKLYGFCFDDNMKALVYEYAINGSLDHVLYENRFDLKWEKLYDIAVETAKALVYLHDGCYDKIIHHDIQPANVLLDFNFSPKITDFGLAKLMSRNLSHLTMTDFRGTAGYAAPETLMPLSGITYKCDVYSFGMMLFEILGRRRNVAKDIWFPKQVWEKFENGRLDELIMECGITVENKEKAKILCMIALWCIQWTPETRPSMNTVSTMLEKEISVTKPPNPFLSSLSVYSMQPSQSSQELIYSDVSSSISSIGESI